MGGNTTEIVSIFSNNNYQTPMNDDADDDLVTETTEALTELSTNYVSPSPDQVLEIVLENILQFITARTDRNSVSLVCKSWYKADSLSRADLFIGNCYVVSPLRVINRFGKIKSLVLKGKPRFADFNLFPTNWGAHFTPWVSSFSSVYPLLEKICLKRISITDEDLALIAKSFVGFQELVLVCCEGFGTSGLSVIATNCRQLRVLELIESEVMDDGVDWVSCFPETGSTCLESLIFDCVDCFVNFEALEQLAVRSPSLRKLMLNRHISIRQLQRLMIRAPHLTHLGTGSFSNSDIVIQGDGGQELLSAFASSKSLICLSGFRDIVAEYLPAIYPVCANLTSLNFSYANIDTEQLKSVICYCHKLQTLWVLDSVCDEGLQAVAETCNDLRELRVFPMHAQEDVETPVSEVGLLAISEGCRKLRSILYFCQQMTNAAVVAMSKNCPELVVFRLCIMGRHRPDHLTGQPMDEGFGAIVKNCKKLTRLAVSGLLTDDAFRQIGEYGKLVRTLSVAFAGNSDTGLKFVLEGCPKLQKLEIRDSPFGDAALLAGLHHYYNMRFLWMSSCNLSLEGCKEVALRMPQLVVEVIRGVLDEERDELGNVEKLYLYRSLEGQRKDVPRFVTIL